MPTSQISTPVDKSESALDALMAFIEERRRARGPVNDLEEFEREARRRFMAAEAALVGEEIGRFDVNVPAVEIDGVSHRQVLRCTQTYMTAAGPASVERSLYSTRQDGDRAVAAMELKAGIVEGYFTPLAAQHAAWAVAHLTPQETETMFERLGGMNPSKATLDRLPKALAERHEARRIEFERKLRAEENVPKEAVAVGVSLDGVLVPMKDGQARQKREVTRALGMLAKGPAGYNEAGCATLTFYDRKGDPLRTIRFARMPEKSKETLKAQLRAELLAILARRPDLRVVKIADGVADNWGYLSLLPDGRKGEHVLDFWHASQHLHEALTAVYGESSPRCETEYVTYRHILRHETDGTEKVIRHLRYLRDQHPRRKKLVAALKYFRNHRHRMHYASLARRNLPIGSGIVEAACKTLVSQRLKRSGMRWRSDGGQAILNLRGFEQSGRFDRAWSMIASTYVHAVKLPGNVIDLASRRRPR
jgi:hypothetical protein